MQPMGFLQDKQPINRQKNAASAIVDINFTHAHAVGQTGCGKTTSFIYPNMDARIKAGHGILLYDFKGKEHMVLKHMASQHGRMDDVVEIGKPWGVHINLLRHLDRKSLESFLLQCIGFDERNKFWADAASKVFFAVYDVVAALEAIHTESERLDGLIPTDAFKTSEITYPHQLTFENVYNHCNAEAKVGTFVDNLDTLRNKVTSQFERVVSRHFDARGLFHDLQERHAYFFRLLLQLENAVEAAKSNLASFADDQESQTTRVSIVISLLPLAGIATRPELNREEQDLIELLNAGKLVTIDCKSMQDEMLESLTMAIFSNLSKRSMFSDAHPVSVFIDEAQRVLTNGQDISLDILRECRVELFLAYQNEELMVNKLGAERYAALAKNLSSGFYYRNPAYYKEHDLSHLATFECIATTAQHELLSIEPFFMESTALFETELRFQQNSGIHARLGLEHLKESALLLFDARLHTAGKVAAYELASGTTFEAELFEPSLRDAVMKRMMAMASQELQCRRYERQEHREYCEEQYDDEGYMFDDEDPFEVFEEDEELTINEEEVHDEDEKEESVAICEENSSSLVELLKDFLDEDDDSGEAA